MGQKQTELVARIGEKNEELARLIDQFLTDGLKLQPVTEPANELEASVSTAVFWLSPTHIELVHSGQEPHCPKPWKFVWQVCRQGEVPVMENPFAFILTEAGRLIPEAIRESEVPGYMHDALASMILHAEASPLLWLPLFRLFAAGRCPLVVCSKDRNYDTLQVLVA